MWKVSFGHMLAGDQYLLLVQYVGAYDERIPTKGLRGMARPTGLFVASSSSMLYSGRGAQPMGHVRGDRGAMSSSGAQNRTYALAD